MNIQHSRRRHSHRAGHPEHTRSKYKDTDEPEDNTMGNKHGTPEADDGEKSKRHSARKGVKSQKQKHDDKRKSGRKSRRKSVDKHKKKKDDGSSDSDSDGKKEKRRSSSHKRRSSHHRSHSESGSKSSTKSELDMTRHHGPERTDEIVIVGAGPAGIHMGAQLHKQGFKKVTILEKSGRLGGKARTYVDEDGIPHELGTCYLHADYVEVRDMLAEYGLEDEDLDLAQGRNIRNVVMNFGGGPKQAVPNIYWLLSQTGDDAADVISNYSEEKMLSTKLWDSVSRYGRLHRKLLGQGYFSLPNKPLNLKDIDMTFEDFLLKNDLEGIIPQLRYQHEAQGYGLISEIPALYGLWWCTPHFIENSFHPNPHPPTMAMIKNGYQNLFHTIAKKEKLKIVFNCNIESITRKPTCDGGKAVTITEHNGKVRTFDYLIMAADMSTQYKIIKDLRADEHEIFSDMVASTLAATLIESDAPANTGQIPPEEFWADRLRVDNAFHGFRNSAKALFLQKPGDVVKREKKVAYQFNMFEPEGHHAVLRKQLLEDLEVVGEKNVKVIKSAPWRYMPRFTQEQINKEYPWRLRGMQGHDRTWFIGSSVCFESVLDCIRYNLGLLNEMQVSDYDVHSEEQHEEGISD